MMATAFLTLPDDRRRNGRFRGVWALVNAFRWALEVQRRCDRAAGVRRVQSGRMLVMLNRLNDAQLAAISLRRRDIPAGAHRLIYGPG